MSKKMTDTEEIPPLKSWQFWNATRKILGETFLSKLYRRCPRQLYRWAADPAFTSDIEKNPIDHITIVLERLAEIGRDDIARSAISIMAGVIGCEVVRAESNFTPDQPTLEAECLDDYPVIARFHKAITQKEGPEVVRHFWQEAKAELDQTYQMAVRGH